MNRTRNTGVVFIDSNVITSPQSSGGALNSTTLTYLATNTQITGSVMTTSSVNFHNGFLSVPLGAPELTKNDFTYMKNNSDEDYKKGLEEFKLYMEKYHKKLIMKIMIKIF